MRSLSFYNFSMRLYAPLLVLAGMAISGGGSLRAQQPASAAPQQPPSVQNQGPPTRIPVTTALVRLVATVTDRRHKFITDLEQSDFRVLEDGQPRPIQRFERETNLPLRIALLMDTSNSIRARLRFEQDAAIDFLNDVVRHNKDMALLITFDNEPQVVQDFTGDVAELTAAIEKQRAGGGTALWDAIFTAAQRLERAPLPQGPDPQVRRLIVVLSDGDDNLSDHALSEAIEAAEHSEAAIYAISTNTDWLAIEEGLPRKSFKSHGEENLEKFADQTGGRVFYPYKVEDLSVSFQDIGNELRSQYFLAYTPAAPLETGKFRKIQVDTDRKGLIVRTRRGYYAIAPAPQPASPGSK